MREDKNRRDDTVNDERLKKRRPSAVILVKSSLREPAIYPSAFDRAVCARVRARVCVRAQRNLACRCRLARKSVSARRAERKNEKLMNTGESDDRRAEPLISR